LKKVAHGGGFEPPTRGFSIQNMIVFSWVKGKKTRRISVFSGVGHHIRTYLEPLSAKMVSFGNFHYISQLDMGRQNRTKFVEIDYWLSYRSGMLSPIEVKRQVFLKTLGV